MALPVGAVACVAALAIGTSTAAASDPKAEYWVGVEGFRDVLATYGGITWAPDGSLYQSGFRLRATGTFSRYDGRQAFPVVTVVGNTVVEETSLEPVAGRRATARGLLGWQWQLGATTIKAFAGVAWGEDSRRSKVSAANVSGWAVGGAAALELWHEASPALWSSLDLAYAVPDGEASARGRIGYRLDPKFSVGPELAWTSTLQGSLARAGIFVRYDDGVREISVSLDAARPSGGQVSPFVAAQWLQRF